MFSGTINARLKVHQDYCSQDYCSQGRLRNVKVCQGIAVTKNAKINSKEGNKIKL